MKRKKQGYNDRLDESLGARRGAESHFRQTLKDRRDESKGMAKRESGHAYSGDHEMDEHDKSRLHHHMQSAHHKFMAQLHRRKMHKKK
jgi:hypothetical protein